MVLAVNKATDQLFKFKTGKYNLKEQAAWKSRTAFIEDTMREILREADTREVYAFAKCYYGIQLTRSELTGRWTLGYQDAVNYWAHSNAKVYQIQ